MGLQSGKGQTGQDQNAGVRLSIQNWDIRNNPFRQNFCRSLRKFRNCIKKRCKTSALNTYQELPQNTTEFNQNIQSSTQKGPMNSAIYRQLLVTTEPNKCKAHRITPHRDPI